MVRPILGTIVVPLPTLVNASLYIQVRAPHSATTRLCRKPPRGIVRECGLVLSSWRSLGWPEALLDAPLTLAVGALICLPSFTCDHIVRSPGPFCLPTGAALLSSDRSTLLGQRSTVANQSTGAGPPTKRFEKTLLVRPIYSRA